MTNTTTHGGPLGTGCPYAAADCSPAYLCAGCAEDLAGGKYLDPAEWGAYLDPAECGAVYPPFPGAACTLPAGHGPDHEDHTNADTHGEILCWTEAGA